MNTNHKNISQYAEQLPEAVVTHRETPQQMVDRIVQQVLEQLMNMPESVKKVIDIPEVVKIMKEVLEKLQLVEVNLDGPRTREYLEKLAVHNRVSEIIGKDAAIIAANDERFDLSA